MNNDIDAVYNLFREQILLPKLLLKSDFISEELIAGRFKSIYHGRGLQRAESILYYPGADVSRIDINSTIRSGFLYFKNKKIDFMRSLFLGKVYLLQEEEEKDKNMFLIIDANSSMTSRIVREKKDKTKLFQTLFSIYLFSLIGVKSGFSVGGLFVDEDVLVSVAPYKSEHISSMLVDRYKDILNAGSSENAKNKHFEGVLRKINSLITKQSLIVVISDFQFMDDFMNTMRFISSKHQIVPVIITDIKEYWERVPERQQGDKIPLIQLYGYKISKYKKSKSWLPSKKKWLEQLQNELFLNRMFPLVFDAEDDENRKMQKIENYFKEFTKI